ncbi:MAG: DUF2330 domain-containing protein [Actinomycetota bacterium]|nr:DUF2330 domain-containing protein [Actinomycetota bacterium]
MRRFLAWAVSFFVFLVIGAAPAMACGGLIGRNGAVNLVRTTTLAGYHNGVEHYVTSFSFAGGGGKFGSIVPLPGVPTKVERGGDWTLQRLARETQPPREAAFDSVRGAAFIAAARVLLTARIDALDLTVLEGGGRSVGSWAKSNGFLLPPDAPEVLDFYAARSPIFLAAKFDGDAAAARGQALGDGTPVHLTIPTKNPWVPLRILGLGKVSTDHVNADVYLLTDEAPDLLPHAGHGFTVPLSEPASATLITDLAADKGMSWIPNSGMWLSYLKIDSTVGQLRYDLAINAHGGAASPRDAGLSKVSAIVESSDRGMIPAAATLLLLVLVTWRAGRRQVLRNADA